jgi:Ulp1 family protease
MIFVDFFQQNICCSQFMCQRAQIVKDGLEKISSELKAPPCNKQRHGNSCGVFALMVINKLYISI